MRNQKLPKYPNIVFKLSTKNKKKAKANKKSNGNHLWKEKYSSMFYLYILKLYYFGKMFLHMIKRFQAQFARYC